MTALRLVCFVLVASTWLLLGRATLQADELVVRIPPAPGPLDNPLKGWCPYANAGPIHQPYSLVFQYISWRELEPTEGAFQFDAWEATWDQGQAKDKHIIFRVYIDYPSKPPGLPEWLRDAGVKERVHTEYGGGLAPDYDDPRMVASMERLIAALGARYNDHPRVAFVQLGLLGFWGEWHTYPRSGLYASQETERRVVEAYKKAFPDKSLMARYARDDVGQQDWIGFHDDMFPKDTDNGQGWSFLAGLRKTGRTENWRTAVVGGEMEPAAAKHWLGDDYDTTMTMLQRAHMTWIGPYAPALVQSDNEEFLSRSETLVRRMGYEFELQTISHPSKIEAKQPARIALTGANRGVAPFYYHWPVEWALLESDGSVAAMAPTDWDIRRWQPGAFAENADLVWDVPPGRYQLAVGIRDPWTNRPRVRFANDRPVVSGWTCLSEIQVSE